MQRFFKFSLKKKRRRNKQQLIGWNEFLLMCTAYEVLLSWTVKWRNLKETKTSIVLHWEQLKMVSKSKWIARSTDRWRSCFSWAVFSLLTQVLSSASTINVQSNRISNCSRSLCCVHEQKCNFMDLITWMAQCLSKIGITKNLLSIPHDCRHDFINCKHC